MHPDSTPIVSALGIFYGSKLVLLSHHSGCRNPIGNLGRKTGAVNIVLTWISGPSTSGITDRYTLTAS
jgi:hypothetical protein